MMYLLFAIFIYQLPHGFLGSVKEIFGVTYFEKPSARCFPNELLEEILIS